LTAVVADGVAPGVRGDDVVPILALGKDKGRDDEDGVPIEFGQVLDPPKRLLLQAEAGDRRQGLGSHRDAGRTLRVRLEDGLDTVFPHDRDGVRSEISESHVSSPSDFGNIASHAHEMGMTCPVAGNSSVFEVEPWLIGWLPADLLAVLSVLLMLWEHG